MESSKIFGGDGGAEECQSSESGWTMYIGSPMDDDDDEESHGMMKKNVYVDDVYDGSDDSMASDASSGPSHHHHHHHQQQQPWEGNGEGAHGHGHDHDDDHGMAQKYHKEDNVKKQVKKKKKKTGFEARNEPKEECLADEKRGIVTVQSGNRARYIGPRK